MGQPVYPYFIFVFLISYLCTCIITTATGWQPICSYIYYYYYYYYYISLKIFSYRLFYVWEILATERRNEWLWYFYVGCYLHNFVSLVHQILIFAFSCKCVVVTDTCIICRCRNVFSLQASVFYVSVQMCSPYRHLYFL